MNTPMLYTTLDSAGAVTAPVHGVAPGLSHLSPTFSPGRCDEGIVIGSSHAFVEYPFPSNMNIEKGTLDFWLKPSFNVTAPGTHNLFGTSNTGVGQLRVRKVSSGTSWLEVTLVDSNDASHVTRVNPSALVQNQWTRVTIAWNFSATGPNVRVWFNRVEASYQNGGPSGPKLFGSSVNFQGKLFIGAHSANDANSAHAMIDDFKIYGFGLNPM